MRQTQPDLISPRFVFSGERLKHICFPLGGIGAGSLSVTGTGRLTDWSLRNRPAIQRANGYSHFAIKAERDGCLLDARVLNGPFEGDANGLLERYGHGAARAALAGLPHFSDVTFIGRFPSAEWRFEQAKFPGAVTMSAFSPFIPHQERDSSMPVAMFSFRIENTTPRPIDYTVAGTLADYLCNAASHDFLQQEGVSALVFRCDDATLHESERGDLALSTEGDGVEHVDHHFRGQWYDSLARYWREFTRAGRLAPRRYETPRPGAHMFGEPEHGTLARRIRVEPGAGADVRFVISWNYPVGHVYWREGQSPEAPPVWRNYYANHWRDSAASGAEALRRWNALERETLAFRDSLFGSSFPEEIVDAASSTLAILRTTTVLRLDSGELWAWEGQNIRSGSCEGSCAHVWNYQQALSNLFPALERTLREVEFRYNQLPTGGLTFRTPLPLGSGFDPIGPCADGHFGAIIKTCREWKASGDETWLRALWPKVRRAIEYAWSSENPDRWDQEQTGVLWGRQHHTLDMELFGPNSWLTSMYLAALRAAAQMARALGEAEFASTCEAIAERGGRWVDANLFNGRHYVQKLDLKNRSAIAPFDIGRLPGTVGAPFMDVYWSEEFGEINYQIGDGCLTDQMLGQWHADLIGLGDLFDADHIDWALNAIFEENFRPEFVDHVNPCRVYAFEDEAGLVLCNWPEGAEKPALPVPYAEEVWTGLEYALASHLVLRGQIERGLTIVRAARARHDGARRNPYNDIECGSYYARALSSYALLNAYLGLSFDQTKGQIGFRPARNGNATYFWSAGRGWGEIDFRERQALLTVKGGELAITEIALPTLPGRATVDGVPALRSGAVIQLSGTRKLQAGSQLAIHCTTGDL